MKYADLRAKFDNPRSVFDQIGRPFAPRLVATFTMFPLVSCNGIAVVDTEKLREKCEVLNDDEVFVLGRAEEADHSLLDELVSNTEGLNPSDNDVSRYHCFIRKGADNVFELWDISATYTAIRLD